MIVVHPSPTADTRTCDYTKVTKETLLASSIQHIEDVRKALDFFESRIERLALVHDFDKIEDIEGFHRDFITGFAQTTWWDAHRQKNRHHLNMPDGVRDDVDLFDVLDYIADCVMAGMARSGTVYNLEMAPELLARAFRNTVQLLKDQVEVAPAPPTFTREW